MSPSSIDESARFMRRVDRVFRIDDVDCSCSLLCLVGRSFRERFSAVFLLDNFEEFHQNSSNQRTAGGIVETVSQTKTAYVFSGIDGLDKMSDRTLMLSLPVVKSRVAQAQKVLDRIAPDFNLTEYISSDDETFKRVFTLQAIAVTVVHIALFDMFTSRGEKPDYLMGCSLGDVARSYCAGALDFDIIIEASWNYHLKASKIEGCGAYYIRVMDGSITPERIQEIKDAGIYFAVHQTPRHFLVTGYLDKLEAWRLSEVAKARYKISPIYDKPLHSPLMTFITDETYKLYAHTVRPMEELKYKMVSSTFIGVIETREQLLKDMVDNFNSTVRWMEALQFAVNGLGVNRLVNVGPVPTLLLFAERTPLNHPVEMVNYLAVSGAEAPHRQVQSKTAPATV